MSDYMLYVELLVEFNTNDIREALEQLEDIQVAKWEADQEYQNR